MERPAELTIILIIEIMAIAIYLILIISNSMG